VELGRQGGASSALYRFMAHLFILDNPPIKDIKQLFAEF
jgi:hypothetical protein